MRARVRQLLAKTKISAEVIKAIRTKLKMPPSNLECINGFVCRWRLKPMGDEPGVGFLDIECITVVGHDNVGIIHHAPKVFHKRSIAFSVSLVPWIIWERVSSDLPLVRPLHGKRQDVPILVCTDQIGFVILPDIATGWSRFDVEEGNAGFGQLSQLTHYLGRHF